MLAGNAVSRETSATLFNNVHSGNHLGNAYIGARSRTYRRRATMRRKWDNCVHFTRTGMSPGEPGYQSMRLILMGLKAKELGAHVNLLADWGTMHSARAVVCMKPKRNASVLWNVVRHENVETRWAKREVHTMGNIPPTS